jgi:hypothetical protein
MSEPLVVTEQQVVAAMAYYEGLHGKGDGVAICSEVAKLTDLLGAMWFIKERSASIPAEGRMAALLRESGALAAAAASEVPPEPSPAS